MFVSEFSDRETQQSKWFYYVVIKDNLVCDVREADVSFSRLVKSYWLPSVP